HQLVAFAGADPVLDKDLAVLEAELATWQGDLDRARSAIQRALAAVDEMEHLDQAWEVAWVCMTGRPVEAERAERAHAAGDAVALADATAVGHALLERGRTAVEQAPWGVSHMTCTSGVGVLKLRPSGPGSRAIPTPRPGRPPLRPSPTAPCMRWPSASGGWPAGVPPPAGAAHA